MEWSEEQAAAAERKVRENSTQRVCQEKQGAPGVRGRSGFQWYPPPVCYRTRSPRGHRTETAKTLCYWTNSELEGRTEAEGMCKDVEKNISAEKAESIFSQDFAELQFCIRLVLGTGNTGLK